MVLELPGLGDWCVSLREELDLALRASAHSARALNECLVSSAVFGLSCVKSFGEGIGCSCSVR